MKPDTALGGCITGSFPVALDGLQEKGFFVFTWSKVFALSRFRTCHWRSLLGILSANPVPKALEVDSPA